MKKIAVKIKSFINKYKLNYIFDYVLFPLFIIIMFDLFFKANGIIVEGFTQISFADVFISIYRNFGIFLLSYSWIFGLNILLISVFNNSKVSKITLLSVFVLLMIINDFKMVAMGAPIKFGDIYYLNGTGGAMAIDYLDSIKGSWILKTIIKAIGVSAVSLIFFFISHYVEVNIKKTKIRIIVVCVGAFLVLNPFIFGNTYKSLIFNKGKLSSSNLLINDYYNYGMMQGMFYDLYMDRVTAPLNYNDKLTVDLVQSYDKMLNENINKPDVVVILSESFSDVNNFHEVKFDKEIMSNYKKLDLSKYAETFNMYSPTNGGQSVNTEFEILTAGRIRFFNDNYIPYNQFYNSKNTQLIPNLIKEFNNNDYVTKYITPWRPDSYRSKFIYSSIGMDELTYKNDLKDIKTKGQYASDEYMTDLILNELKSNNDENKFIYVATSQNHVPYGDNKYSSYDISVTNSTLDKEDTELIHAYAQGVYDADIQLQRLFEEIQKLKKPTIVLFYGDHLPYVMNTKGENVYNKSTYFNSSDNIEKTMRWYTTPVAIISNQKINSFPFELVNTHYLGAYLLGMTDLKMSSYFNFVNQMMYEIPVIDRSFYIKNEELVNNNENELINNYNNVQYKYFVDFD